MGGKGTGRQILRRGVALGLVLVAAWGVSLTADLSGVGGRLAALGGKPAVALLAAQLGELPGEVRGLTGWGRLLLRGSPLLRMGEEAVLESGDSQGPEGPGAPPPEPADRDDEEEPDLQPADQGEGIVEMTGQGKEGSKYLADGGVYVYNRTEWELDASVLGEGTVDTVLGEGPQILIVHTHGSESYTMPPGQEYVASGESRTTDTAFNVVRIGDEIADILSSRGISTIHDRSLYDYPQYNGAYDRSLAAIESYLAKYPGIRFVLDVHRDAITDGDGTVYKVISETDRGPSAQLSLIVGTNGSGLSHDHWRENLKLAAAVQDTILQDYPTLMRPITVRNSRYNQHCTTGSLLVEVGAAGNSLDEALLAAQLFAEGFAKTVTDTGSETN